MKKSMLTAERAERTYAQSGAGHECSSVGPHNARKTKIAAEHNRKKRNNPCTLKRDPERIHESMRRNKLTEYVTEEQVERFIENTERIAKFVELESHLEVVNDPKDGIVINTAIDGRADLIVSGDHHLLSLKEFRGIKIASVDEAVRKLKKRR